MTVQPKHRVISLLIYAALLAAIQYFVIDTGFKPNENAIWFYNGIASLLFGSRLLNPHFTPPADAATNGFVALASVIAGSLVVPAGTFGFVLIAVVAAFCGLVSLLAILVLLVRTPAGIETRPWVRAFDHAVRGMGSPGVIFTIVILTAVWLFHRDRPYEVFAILTVWTAIVALRPAEAVMSFLSWLGEQPRSLNADHVIGDIAAHQSPGIVLVRQQGDRAIERGKPLIVADDNGPWMLGVSLNYVGRDEGNLLRVLTVRLPQTLQNLVREWPSPRGAGIAMELDVPEEDLADIPAIQWINRLCGVVDSDTTLDHLQFEVIEDDDLSEGRLVEVRIGEHMVMYQIIEGLTREEIVQQKNKYGYARAAARKIGRWDAEAGTFTPVKWIPRINAPVFLKEEQKDDVGPTAIGRFPDTSYGVSVNVSEAVTHNTAILGILGIGKSYLAIELVERMISEGVKVICLDLTNQYAELLSEFVDPAYEQRVLNELNAAGGRGTVHQSKEEGGSVNAFSEKLTEQLREFVQTDNGRCLRIYNPASFDVWKQTGFKDFKSGDAAMASLTPCEITSIISDAALNVCQELGMTDQGRVCLVYEEAHSLVPEWNSVVSDGDKGATSRSARAILQGRKYGLGCLLITQRTANVTKTILNQCNTIFAMRTFDDTGKDFLSNYIGSDYANVLPSLEARHAVVFGKASSCENPVLIRLNDRGAFLDGFRGDHPPPELPVSDVGEIAAQTGDQAGAAGDDDLDDEIPF